MGSHARIMSKDSKEGLFDLRQCATLTTPSENSMLSITFNPLLLEMMNSTARLFDLSLLTYAGSDPGLLK